MKFFVVLLFVGFCFASDFDVSLDVSAPLDSRFRVQVGFTNTLNQGQFLLVWNTPFDPVSPAVSFKLLLNSEPVEYQGIVARRANPTKDDYLFFAPGETKVALLDLDAYWDISQMGIYTVQLVANVQDVVLGDAFPSSYRADFTPQTIESYTVIFPIDIATEKRNITTYYSALNTFRNCAGSQTSAVQTAWTNYGKMALRMQTGLSNTAGVYKTWFGVYSATRHNTVSKIVNNEVDDSKTGSYLFDCRGSQCSSGVIAYVYPSDPSAIYLCSAFFTLPAVGPLSQADTIVHEVSHFTVIGGTQDYTYGESSCKQLAKNNPANAVRNADNYAFYAGYV